MFSWYFLPWRKELTKKLWKSLVSLISSKWNFPISFRFSEYWIPQWKKFQIYHIRQPWSTDRRIALRQFSLSIVAKNETKIINPSLFSFSNDDSISISFPDSRKTAQNRVQVLRLSFFVLFFNFLFNSLFDISFIDLCSSLEVPGLFNIH